MLPWQHILRSEPNQQIRHCDTISDQISIKFCTLRARSKFWGVSGSADRGLGDNSIQSLILGGWVTKVFKNGDKKEGGRRVGDNNILIFLCYWLDKKKCNFKKCILGNFFFSYL